MGARVKKSQNNFFNWAGNKLKRGYIFMCAILVGASSLSTLGACIYIANYQMTCIYLISNLIVVRFV